MLQVDIIAWTHFDEDKAFALTGWDTDVTGGEALLEFAGRACYQAWKKSNPATATNRGYLANIVDHDHGSVFEHASVTVYVQGVSRSWSHEIIRHRAGTAWSELSQRYVDVADVRFVTPPALDQDPGITLKSATHVARSAYGALQQKLEASGFKRKQAREAARAVMPNCAETKVVMTANLRAWRHILKMRGSEHADAEMRRWAVATAWELKAKYKNAFQDMHLGFVEGVGDILYFGEYLPEGESTKSYKVFG